VILHSLLPFFPLLCSCLFLFLFFTHFSIVLHCPSYLPFFDVFAAFRLSSFRKCWLKYTRDLIAASVSPTPSSSASVLYLSSLSLPSSFIFFIFPRSFYLFIMSTRYYAVQKGSLDQVRFHAARPSRPNGRHPAKGKGNHLVFTTDRFEADVNVLSVDGSRLWVHRLSDADLQALPGLTDFISAADKIPRAHLHVSDVDAKFAIDYTQFGFPQGFVESNAVDEIAKLLDADLSQEVSNPDRDFPLQLDSTVYFFGQGYEDRDGRVGIHDIHANPEDQELGDGLFLVKRSDGTLAALALAFGEQIHSDRA